MPLKDDSVLKLRVNIYIAAKPFSEGAMRIAYECLVMTEDGSIVPGFEDKEMVFKLSR